MITTSTKAKMYSVTPIYDNSFFKDMLMPKGMYFMRSIHQQDTNSMNSQFCNGLPETMAGEQASKEIGALRSLELRQDAILKRLNDLQSEVEAFKKSVVSNGPRLLPPSCDKNDGRLESSTVDSKLIDGRFKNIVILASPLSVPYSVPVFISELGASSLVNFRVYKHSSTKEKVTDVERHFASSQSDVRNVNVHLILKTDIKEPILVVNPTNQIRGEPNILRFFARLFNDERYGPTNPDLLAKTDILLDEIHQTLLRSTDKYMWLKSIEQLLGKNKFFLGETLSVVDIYTVSVLKQLGSSLHVNGNLSGWYSTTKERFD